MLLWKLTLAYDGTNYNGWQIQPNQPTIQGTLAQAIEHVTGESVLPQGSGRTDAGVHALAQVATFSIAAPIPAANLLRALNRTLPSSIRILSAEPAAAGFHARHSALRKTYEYRIFPRVPYPIAIPPMVDRICSPMLAPYVWDCHLPLDFAILQNAADYIRGTHDFTSFAAVDPDLTTRNTHGTEYTSPQPKTPNPTQDTSSQPKTPNPTHDTSSRPEAKPERRDPCILPEAPTPSRTWAFLERARHPHSTHTANPEPPSNIRTIYHSSWHRHDGLFIYKVTGNGFLHHMVRNLVGTFVEAAARRLSADDIPAILAARNRSAAGPTAPPQGLFLVAVEYE